jgi:hypothetical protein
MCTALIGQLLYIAGKYMHQHLRKYAVELELQFFSFREMWGTHGDTHPRWNVSKHSHALYD